MTSVTTDRRQGVNSGKAIKVSCRAATTVAITLSGEQTVDGVALVTGDRCLVKNQASSVGNGIYVVDTGSWTRAIDFDGTYDIGEGTLIPVNHGNTNVDTTWRVTSTGTLVPGTSGLVLARAVLSSAAAVSFAQAGSGISATLLNNAVEEVVADGASAPSLKNWFSSALSGKKIAWVGDSTTAQLFTNVNVAAYYAANYVTNTGSALNGVTSSNFGSNGNTLQNFLAGTPAGFGVLDVIAAAPDLVIFSYGINDVRQGARTKAQLQADIVTAVSQILAALPSCDIVLRMPNSFITTDVGGNGYVVPNGSAQAYSTILKDAYRALARKWPNVVLFDSQLLEFPETILATYTYMTDQIHPTDAGYDRILDRLAEIISPSGTFNLGRVFNKGYAAHAQASAYATAYSVYPDVVLNRDPNKLITDDYTLLARGVWVSQGAGFIDFSGDQRAMSGIAAGDIVWQNGQAAFLIPSGSTIAALGVNIRISGMGAGVPAYAQTGGYVEVWRSKYSTASGLKAYVGNTLYPAQKMVQIASAGNGFARIAAMPGERTIQDWNPQVTDIFYSPSVGATTLTSATFGLNGANLQILKATDWTTDNGKIGWIFSTVAERPQAQGAAVTAANNLTLGTDGDYFQIAGATQINLLDFTGWKPGRPIKLKFNSTPTVKHNTAVSGNFKPMILNGAVDLVAAANNTLTLVYDWTDSCFYEIGRKV